MIQLGLVAGRLLLVGDLALDGANLPRLLEECHEGEDRGDDREERENCRGYGGDNGGRMVGHAGTPFRTSGPGLRLLGGIVEALRAQMRIGRDRASALITTVRAEAAMTQTEAGSLPRAA